MDIPIILKHVSNFLIVIAPFLVVLFLVFRAARLQVNRIRYFGTAVKHAEIPPDQAKEPGTSADQGKSRCLMKNLRVSAGDHLKGRRGRSR
jgi:hypothetical protein